MHIISFLHFATFFRLAADLVTMSARSFVQTYITRNFNFPLSEHNFLKKNTNNRDI